MADLRVETVTKRFGKLAAVESVSLDVADGEFLVLLGPTGAGKTTTLRLIAGLERPDAGRILIDGIDVTAEPPAARDVTFVFQQYSLYPHLSVYDNLAFPLRAPSRGLPATEIDRTVREVAELLRISDKLDNRATRLSGGQMQRVAIGRALVRRPALYLMDEPLSSLDAKLRSEMRIELKRIQRELGATIVYVTHDQTEAMTLATQVGVLDRGRLVQTGSPREIYQDPVNTYVATRLGTPAINLLPCGVFRDLAMPAGTKTIGIRTEQLRLQSPTVQNRSGHGTAHGRVTRIEHLGDQSHLHIEIGDQSLVSLGAPDSTHRVGDAVGISLDRPLFFDDGGARLHQPLAEAR